MAEKNHLLYFCEEGNAGCENMATTIEQLERELGVKLSKIDMTNDAEKRDLMRKYDITHCDTVPFFYNLKTEKFLCGEPDYADLLAWAA